MLASKQANLLASKTEAWADFLVSAWVLFIAFAICGIITLAGFPIGWKELGTDYSAAGSEVPSGAGMEATALHGIGR